MLAVCQIDRAKRPDLFRRCLFVLRPKLEGPATDAWAGKVNAIVKRVDALDRNVKTEMGERFGGADQKLIEMAQKLSNVDQKMSAMDQNLNEKMSEIDEKMSALETKMDANVEKILGAIGLLGHSV